jgi:AAA+ superfamily predicted ATPase
VAEEELTRGWAALGTALLEREALRGEGPATEPAEAAVDAAEKALLDALDDGPLAAIAASAELDGAATRLLAVCGAVELDRRLQRLVGHLEADPTASRPSVDLLVRLLGPEVAAALADDAPLRRAGLLDVEPGVPLAAARVSVPRRVAWALLDDLSLDPDLPLGTELLVLEPDRVGTHDLVLVHGGDRVRRTQAAVRAARGLAFLVTTPPADADGWRCLVRQATVGGLGVVLELPPGGVAPVVRHWVERAEHLAWALCSSQPVDLLTAPRRDYVEVTAADATVTPQEWAAVFPGSPAPARRPTAEQLFAGRAVPGARADGQEALRRVASGALLSHATRVVPRVAWDDLVLPAAQERQLRALVDRYRQRSTVHDEWGLDLYPSPGVVALFSGPSGTGKTTSAEAIAHELGVDMFRVDLSALVSKYIGETEKNLEQIFSAAHTGNYLLLFDEADSLFGSRSKVEESKDRYANLEVSYLLQRLETYDGLVVLTSNFQGNIDQAFLRRIHLTVHFTIPTAEERRRMWERSLAGAPTTELDLGFVAREFDLTGGSIRNAALTAAFAAAAQGGAVGMVDVLRAVAQELGKLGRRPHDSQFGTWLDQLGPGRW